MEPSHRIEVDISDAFVHLSAWKKCLPTKTTGATPGKNWRQNQILWRRMEEEKEERKRRCVHNTSCIFCRYLDVYSIYIYEHTSPLRIKWTSKAKLMTACGFSRSTISFFPPGMSLDLEWNNGALSMHCSIYNGTVELVQLTMPFTRKKNTIYLRTKRPQLFHLLCAAEVFFGRQPPAQKEMNSEFAASSIAKGSRRVIFGNTLLNRNWDIASSTWFGPRSK